MNEQFLPQVDIIKDLLDFKNSPAKEVLMHPVIETFLEIKWRRISKIFLINFCLYLFFLVSYSMYLANIFYRKNKRKIKITELVVNNNNRFGFVKYSVFHTP